MGAAANNITFHAIPAITGYQHHTVFQPCSPIYRLVETKLWNSCRVKEPIVEAWMGEGRHTSPCGRLTLQSIHWILSQTQATLLQIRLTWTNAFLEEIWRVQTLGGRGWETSWTLRCFTCSVCQKMLRLVLALGCGDRGVLGASVSCILFKLDTGHRLYIWIQIKVRQASN